MYVRMIYIKKKYLNNIKCEKMQTFEFQLYKDIKDLLSRRAIVFWTFCLLKI